MRNKKTIPFDEAVHELPVETITLTVADGPDEGVSISDGKDCISVGSAEGNDLVLSDPTVSRYHAELRRTPSGVLIRDLDSTNGTYCQDVRIEKAVIPMGASLRVGRTLLNLEPGESSHVPLYSGESIGDLRGRSEGMRRLMAQIERVGRTGAAVLVVGESGTGKELIAKAIHDVSPRAGGPFITVDCGAMAANLVASELFGHEKGAFTSADRQHIGAFERADGGTIFLDEIGELPAELQPNLLGALERKRFRRVGGREDIQVDVRIVAATNRDLRAEVNAKRFRLDLYYRLAVVTLGVPPLRDRNDDFEVLIAHFLRECGYEGAVSALFPPSVMTEVKRHRWPGNVRELRNYVEATLAMGEPPQAMYQDFSDADADDREDMIALRPLMPAPYKDARGTVLHQFEEQYLKYWMEATGGNVAKASREAKMDRSHLFQLLRRHKMR